MNRLPARPAITLEQREGQYGNRYYATATISGVVGRGVAKERGDAIRASLRMLHDRLKAIQKGNMPCLRQYADGTYRYSNRAHGWGVVYGYGDTPDLAYNSYLKNLLLLDILRLDPEESKSDRIPAMDEVPSFEEPKKKGLFSRLIRYVKETIE